LTRFIASEAQHGFQLTAVTIKILSLTTLQPSDLAFRSLDDERHGCRVLFEQWRERYTPFIIFHPSDVSPLTFSPLDRRRPTQYSLCSGKIVE
jgi:hypothetical protein